jgi:hypothetical protein
MNQDAALPSNVENSDFELKAVMTNSVNHDPRKQYDAMSPAPPPTFSQLYL